MALMLISDSEWDIMRIIWERAPVTSGAIIAELEASRGWMPTTVKTFLARLVKKSIIQYEKAGRGYVYKPLVTEERCVRDELQAVVARVYGGGVSTQTEHFVFRGAQDPNYMETLARHLEERFGPITSDLAFVPQEPIQVYVHATQKRLHSALGVMEGPSWLRAGQIWGMIHLGPESCFEDIKAEHAAVHTFVLLLMQSINPSAPYWLSQAVATYYGGWMTKEKIDAAGVDVEGIPDFLERFGAPSSYLEFKALHGYEWGYAVVDYILQQFGKEGLRDFLRTSWHPIYGSANE